MAEEKKAKKPERTREQETKGYHLVYNICWPPYHALYPMKTLHRERIPDGAFIACPNHSSLLDPPMAAFALTKKHPVRIMAKKSLLEIPVIGWFMENGGVIGVDRGNADINAIKRSLRVLKDGYPMMISPEGTRVKEIGARGEAHTGPVMLAMKTGVPLLPMYIPQGKKPFRKTTIVIGEPYTIAPAGKRATNAELESAAAELLDKIYALAEENK
jgi:1-acyl-sn-glycerol-3-phosphate acyltransferase